MKHLPMKTMPKIAYFEIAIFLYKNYLMQTLCVFTSHEKWNKDFYVLIATSVGYMYD